VSWKSVCASKKNRGLQVLDLQMENKAYLLRLAWDLAYSLPWSTLMHDRLFHPKYVKARAHQSSSF